MVPSFRETAAMLWRGWPIEKLLMTFAGQLEGCQPAPEQHDLPITIPVGTQLPHAVGLAYAAQYRGDDVVVMAYFGDGATRSEEHTSELQSHSDLVCRLLLEKKKNTTDPYHQTYHQARTHHT